MTSRSYEPISLSDLRKLGELAALDRYDLFSRKAETGSLYGDKLFAVALCQGGALHYLDGKNGIKDLDVWSFYKASQIRMFPPRRRTKLDFGDAKFGTTDDSPHFVGRRVDLIGRSLVADDYSDPVDVLRNYLRAGTTPSARCLAMKAMILIEPLDLIGTVVWPAG